MYLVVFFNMGKNDPRKKNLTVVYSLAIGGLLTTVLGIVMVYYGFPKIIEYQISKDMALTEGTDTYAMWKNPPFPVAFKFYFFNVTNPMQITKGARPKLKEVGPYVYQQYSERHNIKRKDNTLTYNLKKIFHFDQEASGNLTTEDNVTVLDFTILGMTTMASGMFTVGLSLMNSVIASSFGDPKTPFVTTTVGKLLFDGVFMNCSNVLFCGALKTRLPKSMRESKNPPGYLYSLMYQKNNTLDGPYTINTGEFNIKQRGDIITYKNKPTIDAWTGECDKIKGSDGTVFSPIDEQKPPTNVHIFSSDVCRGFSPKLIGKTVTFDISAYRYEVTDELFQSGKTFSKNKCYCEENWSKIYDGCSLNGVFNVKKCNGAPIVNSFPHFYLADKFIGEYIEEGIDPDKDKHGTHMDLEPITGVPLRASKRIQINMELLKFPQVNIFKNVKPGIFPIFWMEEGFELNEQFLGALRGLYKTMKIFKAVFWGLVVVGVLMIFASIYVRNKTAKDFWYLFPSKVDPQNGNINFNTEISPSDFSF